MLHILPRNPERSPFLSLHIFVSSLPLPHELRQSAMKTITTQIELFGDGFSEYLMMDEIAFVMSRRIMLRYIQYLLWSIFGAANRGSGGDGSGRQPSGEPAGSVGEHTRNSIPIEPLADTPHSLEPKLSISGIEGEASSNSVEPKPSTGGVEDEPNNIGVGPEPSSSSVKPEGEPTQHSTKPEPSSSSVKPEGEPTQLSTKLETSSSSGKPEGEHTQHSNISGKTGRQAIIYRNPVTILRDNDPLPETFESLAPSDRDPLLQTLRMSGYIPHSEPSSPGSATDLRKLQELEPEPSTSDSKPNFLQVPHQTYGANRPELDSLPESSTSSARPRFLRAPNQHYVANRRSGAVFEGITPELLNSAQLNSLPESQSEK